VKVEIAQRRGRIIVDYAGMEDLKRIVKMILDE
jgi:hypothetical protein